MVLKWHSCYSLRAVVKAAPWLGRRGSGVVRAGVGLGNAESGMGWGRLSWWAGVLKTGLGGQVLFAL